MHAYTIKQKVSSLNNHRKIEQTLFIKTNSSLVSSDLRKNVKLA